MARTRGLTSASWVGTRGAGLLLALFLGNELIAAVAGPTMLYIAVRAAIIPFAVAAYVLVTGCQMVKLRLAGHQLISPVAGLAVALALLTFQWFGSYPLFVQHP